MRRTKTTESSVTDSNNNHAVDGAIARSRQSPMIDIRSRISRRAARAMNVARVYSGTAILSRTAVEDIEKKLQTE